MKVTSNTFAQQPIKAIKEAQKALDQSISRLGTGERFTKPNTDIGNFLLAEAYRTQIANTIVAQRNSLSAIGILETADTALDEIDNILTRMGAIAVEASSSTISASARESLKNEAGTLLAEIESISSKTKIGDQYLLNGSFAGKRVQTGPSRGDSQILTISSADPQYLGSHVVTGPTRDALAAAQSASANTTTASEDISLIGNGISATIDVSDNDSAKALASKANSFSGQTLVNAEAKTHAFLFSTNASNETYSISINGASTSNFTISSSSVTDAVTKINLISGTTGVLATATVSNQVLLADTTGEDITIENNSSGTSLDVQAVKYDGTSTQGNAVSLAAGGSTNNDATRVIGTLRLTSSKGFNLTQSGTPSLGYITTGSSTLSKLSDLDFSSSTTSGEAITIISDAQSQISVIRGTVAGEINRLDFRSNFLDASIDELGFAESAISDADVAVESAKLAKAMVLQKTATALLAQANAAPEIVLKLIREAA